MIGDEFSARCEECGNEAYVDSLPLKVTSAAGAQLPIGWRVWKSADGDLHFLCPLHNDDEHLARYRDPDWIEEA